MSWLSNPLKYAGDLLDSVDRKADNALEKDGSDAPSSAPRQHRTTDNRDSSPSPRRYIPRRERQQRQQLASQQQPPRTNNHHAVTSLGATRIAEVDAPHSTAQGTQAPPQAVTTPAPPPSAPTLLSQKGGSGGGAAVAERAGGGNGDATPASMPLSVPAVGAASRPLPSSSSARAATRTGGPRDSAAPGDTSSARKRDDRSDTSSGGEPSMGMDAAVASAAASTLAPSGDAPMTRAHHPSNTPQVARGDPAQPPSSSASVARTLADRDAQVSALQAEVLQLNTELDDLDKQMVRAQSRIDSARDTEADLRSQLKDALAETKQARRDAERLARQTAGTDVASVERLKRNLEEAEDEIDTLRQQLDAKATSQSQALASLRRELRASESAAQDAASDYSAARLAAQRREEELLNEASELQQALAQAQQALQQKAGDVAQLSSSSTTAEAEADLRREAARAAEAALLAERRQSSMMRRDVRALTEKVARLEIQVETSRRQVQSVTQERNSTVEDLQRQLEEAKSAVRSDRSSALEARLRTMAESVVTNQGRIDELRSEKAALQRRLEREQSLRREAEAAVNAVYGGGSGDAGEDGFGSGGTSSTDLEMGGDVGFSTPRKSGLTLRSRGVRQRLLRASPAMSKLQPIAQNPKVAKAIDVVDRFTLRTGFFLSREPLARLMFLVYLVILHLWALFILSFHTHRLDIDSSGADSGAAALPTPADHPFVQNAP